MMVSRLMTFVSGRRIDIAFLNKLSLKNKGFHGMKPSHRIIVLNKTLSWNNKDESDRASFLDEAKEND